MGDKAFDHDEDDDACATPAAAEAGLPLRPPSRWRRCAAR